ncbi:DUF3152 domain-containing protein [Corynebacterium poyangense]|uniref:DUF3152 domain-containing protein n=2 Tax=Corynebacterium poyangense TaxID=2684405 RepID=A0A7H0SML8_9CORY|nr:DUF3152 domain-containing protein [Corynebacterium poyangense]MBZ8176899.1 DUF3152 domain-containing protein [Corynebacterium poyangense]QNQ89793.1 DUF3152 domain-containing protein [Corynebacterium poyangense]
MSHHRPSTPSRFRGGSQWQPGSVGIVALTVVLGVLSIGIVAQVLRETWTGQSSTETTAQGSASALGPQPETGLQPELDRDGRKLPPGGRYSEAGDKTFRVVGQPGLRVGEGKERTYKYVVEIENGVDTASTGGDDAFSAIVDATLSDPRGWIADPKYRFEHVTPDADPDLRIQLSSLATTHEACGNELELETSCFTSDGNRVVVNHSRWVRGTSTYQGDLGAYRQYVINHEVGHGIGFAQHEACRGTGQLAPIMMQQTLSLGNAELHRIDPQEVYPDNDAHCIANPWPYPFPENQR